MTTSCVGWRGRPADMVNGIEITNLAAFRRELKVAQGNARDLTKVIKAAGQPLLAHARANIPKGATGKLASTAKISASATKGKLIIPQPYAPVAAFQRRFGMNPPAPRFGVPDLVAVQAPMFDIITKGIWNIITINGWAEGPGP